MDGDNNASVNFDSTFGSEQASVPAQPKPEETLSYWQSKYTGLQGHASKLKKEFDSLAGQLSQRNMELEALRLDSETKLGGLSQSLAEKEKALADQLAANASYKWKNDTREVLAKNPKYKPFIADFDEGVLRVDGLEGDALTGYLDKYVARFGSVAESARADGIQEVASGAAPTPKTPAQTALKTADQMLEELMQLSPNSPQYAQVFALYAEATKGQTLIETRGRGGI